jgi:hypothetical protein
MTSRLFHGFFLARSARKIYGANHPEEQIRINAPALSNDPP